MADNLMMVGCRVFISKTVWSKDGFKVLSYVEKHFTSDYELIFSRGSSMPVAIEFKSPDIAREVFTLLTLTELQLIYEK
jgi:hypothetical protein